MKFPTKKAVGPYVYPPTRMELRGWKDWYNWNIIMYKNGNYIHFSAEHCEKYWLYVKKKL